MRILFTLSDYVLIEILICREFHDFAGSGLIHLLGGVQAIIGPIMLGPRPGRFNENGVGTQSCWDNHACRFNEKGVGNPIVLAD
jgi:ammonia channel protein AmtB